MLKTVKINNFRGLVGEVNLDLKIDKRTHKKRPDFSYFDLGKHKISKVLGIYGPNAIGKTSILEAIFVVRNIALGNLQALQGFRLTKHKFFLDQPISFYVEFIHNQKLYKYHLTLDIQQGLLKILSEKLIKVENQRSYTIFSRNENKVKISGLSQSQLSQINIHPQISLIASTYIFFKELTEIYKYLQNTNLLEPIAIFKAYGSPHYLGLPKWLDEILSDENLKFQLMNYLQQADLTITNIEVVKEKLPQGERYSLNFTHQIDGKSFNLNLADESNGTLEFLSYLAYWFYLHKLGGGVLLIDEIDAHLHPYLINKFLKFLTSQKNSNIQVIFTTHDISILYEKSLAKDQIGFLDKKPDSNQDEKIFYKLSDFGKQIRDEYDWLKMYMLGQLGAVPFLEN